MLYYIGKTKMRHVLKFKHCREKYLVIYHPIISLATAIVTKTGFFRVFTNVTTTSLKNSRTFSFFSAPVFTPSGGSMC